MITWIIESNVFAEVCFDEMIAHLKDRAIPHHIVRIIPFIHEVDGKVPVVDGPCVVYGSIGVQKLAKAQGWRPGVFGDATSFSEETAIAKVGDLMLNASARRMPISKVTSWFANSSEWTSNDQFFIKPNTDTKEFAGMVMEVHEFETWFNRMNDIGYLDGNDFEVMIARPKKLELGCEWRVVVADGKIVTSSLYRQYGIVKAERHIIPEVEEVVMSAHALFAPASVYVIDVARHGDDYKIVEYNTFNSAGFYACDVKAIIDAVNETVSRES